jgi:molybdopterin converting factor small subunit
MPPPGILPRLMGRITFTSNLQRHVPSPPARIEGKTVREVLDRVFAENPLLRSYILDDQGRVRRHVNIFLNDSAITDRDRLTDSVRPDDDIYVFQALSGG